jgi:PEP-CTERM/exosortase A-associated glycosyltransferase
MRDMITSEHVSAVPVATTGNGNSTTVLHVFDHSWPILSGYSVRSRNLVTAQHRLGQRILALTGPLHQIDEPNATDVMLDGVAYVRTPLQGPVAKSAVKNRWPLLREYEVVRVLRNRILEIVSQQPISVVYAHSPALCGLAALQAARKKGLPFVYEIRAFWEDAAVDQNRTRTTSLKYAVTRKLETYVSQRADAVSAIAEQMLSELHARGIPQEKLFHVPNGVDIERFSPIDRDESLARELNLGEGPVIGFFGSLYRYEGVSWMIRAASQLRSRGHKFSILIIGQGEDFPAIGEAVRECNASEYVRHIESVPHEQIRRYYSILDIVAHPRHSVRLTELVTPLKPLEAMALAKPVLASNLAAVRELVEDERTGLLFRPADADDFCRQAERLLTSPELRHKLGESGRAFVCRERNWNVLAQRYAEIYDFVLAKRRGARAAASPV